MFKKVMSALAKISSKIHLPYTRKRVTQAQVIKAIELLLPGDVILTHVDGELSNIALSHWSHAGIYSGGKVYEATTHGVVDSMLVYFLSHKDDFLILRPQFDFDSASLDSFLNKNLGVPYDFEFESDDQQFYCFELAAVSLMSHSSVVINPIKTPAGYQYLAKSFLTDIFKPVSI